MWYCTLERIVLPERRLASLYIQQMHRIAINSIDSWDKESYAGESDLTGQAAESC